ncbi:nickel-dependent malate racemase, LarAH5 family [Desulfocurvus sp. DL9XJH121]
MNFSLHFDHGSKSIELPDHLTVDVLSPVSPPLLEDPAKSLKDCLANCEAARFEGLAAPKSVAIAVPDETRPFPTSELLPVLVDHVLSRWPELSAESITVHVGGGLHPPMDEEGLAQLVPPEIRRGVKVVPHDAKNDPLADLGVTSRGTPVQISKAYAEADLRLVMGQVDPHQFAGFTGGAKGVCVGLAGPEMIRRNHSMLIQERALPGVLADNPVRQDLNEAGDMVGIHLVVNVVNGPDKRPVWLGANTHRELLAEASKVCASVFGVELDAPYDIVIASCGGYPKDICLYQSQKGMFNAAMAAAPHGKILLLAACPQGIGDEAFEEYAAQFDSMEAMGEEFLNREFKVGAHKGYLFSCSTRGREVVLDTEMDPKALSRCHLASGSAQETLQRWTANLPEGARVAVVPHANTTFFHYGDAHA